MKYLINKKSGVIYRIRSTFVYNGERSYVLQPRGGSKRTISIRECSISKLLKIYKPKFFEKIKLFFEFL